MGFLQLFSDEDWVYHHSLDRNPPPGTFEPHVHPTKYEMLYVLSGRGRYHAEGQSYPLHPGMLFIARNQETHWVEIDADTPYERIVFLLNPKRVRDTDPQGLLLDPFENRPLGQDNAYTDAVFKSSTLIIRSQPYNATPAEQRLFAISQIFSFLCELYTAYVSRGENCTERQQKQQAIQPALDFIHEHLFEKLSLEDVARHTYISTSQLNRLFRETLGSSVYEYIILRRLTAAKYKIDTGMSATQAAAECGFNTYSSFYKVYLKRFGASPSAGSRRQGEEEER